MGTEIDYGEIEEVLERIMGGSVSFEEMVTEMTAGEGAAFSPGKMLSAFAESISGQLKLHGEHIAGLILLILSAAVLSAVARAFRNKQISEMGFYMIYLLMFLIMLRSFGICYEMTETVLRDLTDFMKALMPAYLLAAAVSTYRTSAVVYYEGFLLLVYYLQKLTVYFLLPAIRCYVVFSVFGCINGEDFFSKGRENLKRLILFSMKAMIAATAGLQLIQGMLSPAIDEFKQMVLSRGLSGLGSIGGAAQNAADVLLGSGMLLKNGIGAAAAVILVLICLAPAAKAGCYVLFYHLLAAVSEPVSDRRLTEAVSMMGESIGLLVRLLFTVCALFLLTVAVVCLTTGGVR